jgi:hypothetical protein
MAFASLKDIYEAEKIPVPAAIAAPPGVGSGSFRAALVAKEGAIANTVAHLVATARELQANQVEAFKTLQDLDQDLSKQVSDLKIWSDDLGVALNIRRRARAAIFEEIYRLPHDVVGRPEEDIEFFRETSRRIVSLLDIFIRAGEEFRLSMVALIDEGQGNGRAVGLAASGFKIGFVGAAICALAQLVGQPEVATLAAMLAGVGGIFIFVGVLGDQYARQTW